MEDKLVLYGRPFESRLLLGTARYESPRQLAEADERAHAAQEQFRPGLDLNRASKAELRLIPGIGDALAQRIVDHRDQNGDFCDDMIDVATRAGRRLSQRRYPLPTNSVVSIHRRP